MFFATFHNDCEYTLIHVSSVHEKVCLVCERKWCTTIGLI